MDSDRLRRLFAVTEHRTFRVYSCPEKIAQEARGVFGCHLFTRCPDCRVVFEGFAYWGCNGHLQGTLDTPADDAYITRRGWALTRDGGPIYYAAGPVPRG